MPLGKDYVLTDADFAALGFEKYDAPVLDMPVGRVRPYWLHGETGTQFGRNERWTLGDVLMLTYTRGVVVGKNESRREMRRHLGLDR